MAPSSSPAPASAKTVLVTTRLDGATYDALSQLARKADRTIAAEVRRAVRLYLEAEAVAA
jgi:predicted transcriptional regulator